MPEFYADWSRMFSLSEELRAASIRLKSLVEQTGSIRNNLVIGNEEAIQIHNALNKSNSKSERIIVSLRKSSEAMEQAANTYKNTEMKLLDNDNYSGEGKNSQNQDRLNITGMEVLFGVLSQLISPMPVIGIARGLLGYFLGNNPSVNVAGDLFGGSVNGESKVTFGIDPDTGLKDVRAEVGFDAEGHLLDGSITTNLGMVSGNAGLTIGAISASGKIGGSLYKDGKFAPGIEAEIKASVAAAKGSAGVSYGSEKNNAHINTEGTLFGAEAEASGRAGVITYEDEKGNVKTEVGVEGKVGAEAYIAKGEISGGFTIAGIKVDVGIGGKVGGAGVSAEGRLTAGGAKGKIGAGLGIGGDIELSIDWSNAEIFGVQLSDLLSF